MKIHPLNILIIGGGGREHALAWKIRQSAQAARVFVAPGNGGTALEPGIENVAIAATDSEKLLAFARELQIGLTIVGPEAPLALGLVNLFQAQGLLCLGPTQAAAQLETSKAFSKDFMARHAIPTANYATFTDLDVAVHYMQQQTFPLVIKADGLAAGKGVVIVNNLAEGLQALQHLLNNQAALKAPQRVVIEEFLLGEEASFIVLTDGVHAIPLATAQDHKTRDDGDVGPNTGGMGAYSPAPVVTPKLQDHIMKTIIYPTLNAMTAEGHPYHGFLYAGLMINGPANVNVLEFNCRLGDPETQPIILRLKSDLVEVCLAAVEHRLASILLQWDPRPAVGVVLAAKGYPNQYPQDDLIVGLPTTDTTDYKIFHAGTRLKNHQIHTAGGRVLCVTALGKTILAAQQKAYAITKTINWSNCYYRTDIGHKAVKREMIAPSGTQS